MTPLLTFGDLPGVGHPKENPKVHAAALQGAGRGMLCFRQTLSLNPPEVVPMPLDFDERRPLPPGIHDATLEEIERHFAFTYRAASSCSPN